MKAVNDKHHLEKNIKNSYGPNRKIPMSQTTNLEETICKSFYYFLIEKISQLLPVEAVSEKVYQIRQKNFLGGISMFAGMLLEIEDDCLKLSLEEPILNKIEGHGALYNNIVIDENGEIELHSFKKIAGKKQRRHKLL